MYDHTRLQAGEHAVELNVDIHARHHDVAGIDEQHVAGLHLGRQGGVGLLKRAAQQCHVQLADVAPGRRVDAGQGAAACVLQRAGDHMG